ncbi:MAG: CAAX protease family protein [Flavobacterium sp. MedPE-SWcel]|uniref:CPBP family intramembrane glutamic endopeptidase n=1 Tax=uncultured Flavobacterium sp. TaxID=165435 RepID=UPI00091BEEEB|nr:CPBP family intramembrane glutamic endopeptidase [uncultured Flavobacterium sp.]OIQ20134.1 MAG: CAAX protease family protein [Flavobacterium sp. MedPE-SWcel]
MFIKQAYTKNFDFTKYLPIPIIFLALIVLNYLTIELMNIDVEELLREQVEEKGTNQVFFETLLPMAVLLVALLSWVKYAHKQSITSLTTAREKIDWKRIFFSFGLWGGITAALVGIAYVSSPESFILNFKPIPFAILAFVAIIMVPMQTSFEEYLFRGYLMQGIGVVTRSRLIPLIITSVIFGVMHIANPEVGKIGYILLFYYVGTGFLLGIITLMDDGMELALGFHAANNLISALLVTSDWTAFQTDSLLKDTAQPSTGFDILLPLLIIYPIILFIFSKKYRWSNWKEKLTDRVSID